MINANIPTPPEDGACKLYSVRGEWVWVKEKKGDEGMLSHYSRIQYIKDWNNGIHNELTFKAKTTNDREWRKVICKYLSDDLLEKISGHEEDEKMLNLLPVLTLIDHGMAYTASKYVSKIESLSGWNLTEWLINSLDVIESESTYVEGSESVEDDPSTDGDSVETLETTNTDDTDVIS